MTGKFTIIRSSNQRGGLNPDAVETLSASFTSRLYHANYHLRHPFGIYNVSLNKILSSFEDVLEALSSATQHDLRSNKLDPKWDKNLLYNLEKLLYTLMEHMDDCESILQCFFPQGTKLNRETVVKAYQSSIDSYRTHVGKVVNHLKHKQGRLRTIGMFVADVPHLGYFVEGLADDGSLGPAPNIHSNGSTALSYSRDIRFHLHGMYYVSSKLSQAVETIAPLNKNNPSYQITDTNARLERIISCIAGLPMIVFPDELRKDFPLFVLDHLPSEGVKMTAYLKRLPHGLRTAPSPAVYITFYKGDGVSRAYRMPYSN